MSEPTRKFRMPKWLITALAIIAIIVVGYGGRSFFTNSEPQDVGNAASAASATPSTNPNPPETSKVAPPTGNPKLTTTAPATPASAMAGTWRGMTMSAKIDDDGKAVVSIPDGDIGCDGRASTSLGGSGETIVCTIHGSLNLKFDSSSEAMGSYGNVWMAESDSPGGPEREVTPTFWPDEAPQRGTEATFTLDAARGVLKYKDLSLRATLCGPKATAAAKKECGI